jgi:hypothetical protein
VTERPLFIDPIALSAGDDVDDGGVPLWFTVVALALLATAAYYLLTFWDGPRLSSPHDFVDGRTAYENAVPVESPAR